MGNNDIENRKKGIHSIFNNARSIDADGFEGERRQGVVDLLNLGFKVGLFPVILTIRILSGLWKMWAKKGDYDRDNNNWKD